MFPPPIHPFSTTAIFFKYKTFSLPFPNNYEWLYKAVAYLEQTDNEIIVASGNGEFFSFEKKDIDSDKINLKKIKTNIKDLIQDEEFYFYGQLGVRDLLILDNKILFSFQKEQTSGCYNTSIMISDLDLNYLDFSEFFSYEDCISSKKLEK